MTRLITQITLGLMLLFGAGILIPKGIFFLKLRRTARGIMYILLGALSAFFSIMSFQYAWLIK
jgi:hypothetical protein